MACSCKDRKAKKSGTYTVTLPGGMKINKTSEAAALAFAAKSPGATVSKKA
jgi:hypothetical protein